MDSGYFVFPANNRWSRKNIQSHLIFAVKLAFVIMDKFLLYVICICEKYSVLSGFGYVKNHVFLM